MTTGILPFPGTEKNIIKNGFDFEIDLSWFPIISTCWSMIGIFIGTQWIAEPWVKETNWFIGQSTFIPIFFYRMSVWLLVLITLHSFSAITFFFFGATNWIILLLVQDKLEIDPINHSLLSLIFPISKLPSNKIDSEASKKVTFWMTFLGNSIIFFIYITLFCLYKFELYNPWKRYNNKIMLNEEVFRKSIPVVMALFVASTFPIFLIHFLQFHR